MCPSLRATLANAPRPFDPAPAPTMSCVIRLVCSLFLFLGALTVKVGELPLIGPISNQGSSFSPGTVYVGYKGLIHLLLIFSGFVTSL